MFLASARARATRKLTCQVTKTLEKKNTPPLLNVLVFLPDLQLKKKKKTNIRFFSTCDSAPTGTGADVTGLVFHLLSNSLGKSEAS